MSSFTNDGSVTIAGISMAVCYRCGQYYYPNSNGVHVCPAPANQLYSNNYLGSSTFTIPKAAPTMDGTKYTVICASDYAQFDTIEQAQAKAEALAHQKSADAYILKPIKKVSPKRDVVTTDL